MKLWNELTEKATIIKLKDLGKSDRFKETNVPSFYGEDDKPIYVQSTRMGIKLRPVEEGSFFELSEEKRKEFSKELLNEAENLECYYFMEIRETRVTDPDTNNKYYGYLLRGSRKHRSL